MEFEGERIISLITIDDEKIVKTPISLNVEIDQILTQIYETMVDGTRKMMRSCKYKPLDAKLAQTCFSHNIQFLLAINKVDFSNYTEISISNFQANPDSLTEFLDINKKDSIEDLKERDNLMGNTLAKL